MSALTRRQREVLDFVTDFIRTKRYSPSLDEIARHFGLQSVASVHRRVKNLERKGYITRDFNRSRSIDVVDTKAHCSGCRCEERIVAEVEEAMEAR